MSERIYGIDLGTSTSAVAYADANDVKLVRAQGPERSDITPSKVCIAEGPTAYVGRVVDMVVEEFQFEDEEVGPGERRRHYRSFEEFKRDLDNPGQKPTEYQSPIAGTCWTPTCLSALVLRKLAQDVALTHRDAPLRKAVITHPQHFYIGQKKATAKAASLANIEVAMTVSEPLAAAVDLRYGANPVRGLVALVDLGGGTLDINILDVQNGKLRVVGGAGDPLLGGKDFDEDTLELIDRLVLRQIGSNLESIATPSQRMEALKVARDAKERLQLSRRYSNVIRAGDETVAFEIRRRAFEEACEGRVAAMLDCFEEALRVAGCGHDKLVEVALVGGSARLLCVQSALRMVVGDGRVRIAEDPDSAVARGAALLGYQLQTRGEASIAMEEGEAAEQPVVSGVASASPIQIENELPRHLGIMVDRVAKGGVSGGRYPNALIERGTRIPHRSSRTFHTIVHNATAVAIDVVEFEESRFQVEVEEIGKLMVDELPPGLPAGTPVEVAFDVNLGGDLKVTASVSGRSVVANIVRDEAAPSMEQPASGGECSVLATRIPIKTTEI